MLVLVLGIGASAAFTRDHRRFGSDETAGTRALFVLAGLVWVVFGVVLLGLAWSPAPSPSRCCSGSSPSFYGVSHIATGTRLRRTGHVLHSVLHDAPPEPGRA